jgi:hypothetical protein
MLSNTLVTNEVKNAAGTEVEFSRISTSERKTEFAATAETPQLPNRILISHQEIGAGVSKRRRSLLSTRKTVLGVSTNPVTCIVNLTIDIPVGDLSTLDAPKDALAQIMSLVASLGASTTILYDGTGNGAVCLLKGEL